jgi:hypothetical protein
MQHRCRPFDVSQRKHGRLQRKTWRPVWLARDRGRDALKSNEVPEHEFSTETSTHREFGVGSNPDQVVVNN